MRWFLSACLLGGLSALFRHWQWPYADWVNLAGFGVLLLGLFLWLNDTRPYWSGGWSRASNGDAAIDWIPTDTASYIGSCDAGDGGCSAD